MEKFNLSSIFLFVKRRYDIMEIFDNITSRFGNWIKVEDGDNPNVTIEDFDYSIGINGSIIQKHCEKCIAVNKCWFKSEKHKKPEPYELFGVKVLDDVLDIVTPGLYHFKCYCYESSIISPNAEDIELIVPIGKEEWLYRDKKEWINALGYKDFNQFLEIVYKKIKEAYCIGDYIIINHSKYGIKINLFITVPGNGEKQNRNYNLKSAFMIFPNGKLKCNTIIGGKW